MGWFRKLLPISAFAVGSTALLVQTTLLYPWHNKLDDQFKKISEANKLHYQKLEKHQKEKATHISKIEEKVNKFLLMEAELERMEAQTGVSKHPSDINRILHDLEDHKKTPPQN